MITATRIAALPPVALALAAAVGLSAAALYFPPALLLGGVLIGWAVAKMPRQTPVVDPVAAKAAAAAAAAEERRRLMFDSVTDLSIIMLDVLGRVTAWNAGAERITGHSAEEILQRHYDCFFPAEDVAQDLPGTALVVAAHNGKHETEGWRVRRDGSRYWAHEMLSTLRDDAGQLLGFVLMSRDQTQRKRAEEALIASEQRYRSVVNLLHEGLVLLDADGRILTVNPAAESMLGRSLAELRGRSIAEGNWNAVDANGTALSSEDCPTQRTLRTGEAQSRVTVGLHRADGSLVWVQESTMPIALPGSPAANGVLVSLTDITTQRNVEQALRESEAKFRRIADANAVGFIFGDMRGRIDEANDAFLDMVGYTRDEFAAGGIDYAELTPLDWRERDRASMAQLMETGVARPWEKELLRKDGTRVPILLTVAMLQGSRDRWVAVVQDLSERRRAEQLLARSNLLRQAILDAAPFSIIASDAQGTIRAMNPAAERLLGYTRDDLVDRASLAAVHEPEELAQRSRCMPRTACGSAQGVLEAIVARARSGEADEGTWTYRRKDGSTVSVNQAVTALRDEQGVLTGFLCIAYDITERQRAEEHIRRVAHHDPLTGLPNRALLMDRLEQALVRARRDGSSVGVLNVDLDHFKRINDSLGHHIGDQLLLGVAEQLRGCVRASDTVARMGGDEFVIVMPDVRQADCITRVAAAIVDRVGAPMQVAEHELQVTPSVGVSMFPQDATDAYALLRNADAAMYQAKDGGRATFQVFSESMMRASAERLALETALRRALDRDELSIAFQPQINLRTGDVVGMEALARWRHPELGAVSPEAFVPVAEQTGLILPIGEWILRSACEHTRRLQTDLGRNLRVAVNLSPRQFRQKNLLRTIEHALADSGLAPNCLELEITEGVLMQDSAETVATLKRIRALGVSVAIDDFGTGYSSLSYLTRFPVDKLKIDRAFVRDVIDDPNDAAVANAIIAMAHNLRIRVLAEGVETAGQLAYLIDRRCDEAQGFHIGMPSGAAEFAELVRRRGARLRREAIPGHRHLSVAK